MSYSHSYIQTFKTCPLQCFFSNELKLEKIDEDKTEHHLRFGSAGHKALKALYLGDSLENAKKEFKEEYSKQLDEEDQAKTSENWMKVLEAYCKKQLKEDLMNWKVISVEEKDAFNYAEEDSFTLMLDLVMENKQYGGIYGFDHKIVGGKKATLSFEFWNQFEPNSQVTKYYSYITKKYGDCSGFYINAFGMGYRSRAYKGEPAGFWFRLGRQMFNRNQAQLELEEKDTAYWIKRIEDCKSSGYWGANTESCRWCSFRPVCSAGWTWQNDQELIMIQYKQKTKQPIAASEDDNEPTRISASKT